MGLHQQNDCAGFRAFCDRFGVEAGREVLERVCEAQCGGLADGVTILDVHQHNACNHTLSGTITHAGETFGFIVCNGDRNGTTVNAWGDPEDVGTYEAPPATVWTLVPRKSAMELSAGMLGVYRAWTKEPWFKEQVQGYNYDRHFAPGGKTESHYRALAAKRGLRIASAEEAEQYLKPIDAAAHEAERAEIQRTAEAFASLSSTPSEGGVS